MYFFEIFATVLTSFKNFYRDYLALTKAWIMIAALRCSLEYPVVRGSSCLFARALVFYIRNISSCFWLNLLVDLRVMLSLGVSPFLALFFGLAFFRFQPRSGAIWSITEYRPSLVWRAFCFLDELFELDDDSFLLESWMLTRIFSEYYDDLPTAMGPPLLLLL